MKIGRKMISAGVAVIALGTGLAVAQVGPARAGGSGSSQGAVAQGGVFDALKMTPMQQVLLDIISWKQSNALYLLGGTVSRVDYDSLSPQMKDARMEVIRACNLYHRATLTAPQQTQFDRTILDPVGLPLPQKWEQMRLKGTLVKSLLSPTKKQEEQAISVLNTFRDRNLAIWGRGNGGGYEANLELLIKDFRSILNSAQLKEYDQLIGAYDRDIEAAKRSVGVKG